MQGGQGAWESVMSKSKIFTPYMDQKFTTHPARKRLTNPRGELQYSYRNGDGYVRGPRGVRVCEEHIQNIQTIYGPNVYPHLPPVWKQWQSWGGESQYLYSGIDGYVMAPKGVRVCEEQIQNSRTIKWSKYFHD